jgi:hypothetical protein
MNSGIPSIRQDCSGIKNGRCILLYSLETLREQQTTLLRILAVKFASGAEIGIELWGL